MGFKFVDLFSGIGGIRLGLESAGGTCVLSCDSDKYARKTYEAWFGDTPHDDIKTLDAGAVPECDLIAAGFPCQPFSGAGVSKRNALGLPSGFADPRGTLFYEVCRIIKVKRPQIVLLENVAKLFSHDKGKTWQTIKASLQALGYVVHWTTIDACGWVPQYRKRAFVVALDKASYGPAHSWAWPTAPAPSLPLGSILDDPETIPDKYTMSPRLWASLNAHAARHQAKGNGFGFGLADLDKPSRTLLARYYKDGSEILIPTAGPTPRRLTPRECLRLMGFPDSLPQVCSDTQTYKQAGNAVVPAVAGHISLNIEQCKIRR